MLSQVAHNWLDAYLPSIPTAFSSAIGEKADQDQQSKLLRWARFQLEVATALARKEEEQPVLVHWHFGFGSDEFQRQLFQALSLLLRVEAAQFSLAGWPLLPAWLADNAAASGQLQLFNPMCWGSSLNQLTYWPATVEGQQVLVSSESGQRLATLPTAQPALYEADCLPGISAHDAAERMRAYYLPAAGAAEPAMPAGVVSGCPLPVAAWVGKGQGVEMNEEGLRAARSAGSSPLLWRVGAGTGKRALLSRSSVLFFWGRVPDAGTFDRSTHPHVQLILSATSRLRSLRWGEVPVRWQTRQTGPAMAAWFGLPPARSFCYQAADFYCTDADAQEEQLTQLLAQYRTLQDQVNQRLADAGETELLTALPWNLLHWVRDAASAEAVYQHKARTLALAGADAQPLATLLRGITTHLAALRPMWQQLAALPTTEPAYVVVPIHIARPKHLVAWLPLHRDLRSQLLPELAHLTFISLSELKRTAEHPTRPIYLTTVEPRYWWALRQLPAATELRGLWYRPLLHDSYCHALSQQHLFESEELYQLLLPLAALAPNPDQAAEELATDLLATVDSLRLPPYVAPARFQRIDAPARQARENVLNWPRLQQLEKAGLPAVAEWQETPSRAATQTTAQVGELPEEPLWWEIDPELLLTAEDDQLAGATGLLQQLELEEEEAAVFETESSEPVPLRPVGGAASGRRGAAMRPSRWVWRRDAARQDVFRTCRESELQAGDYYFDEAALKRRLRQAATQGARPLSVQGLPFWKQALREYVKTKCGGRSVSLFRKMQRGDFAGTQLDLKEKTFMRDYLAWDEEKRHQVSSTRLPGSYQNRAAVAQVIGSGAQDEMQLLGWELATGRSLSAVEGDRLRQELQDARQALLAWWANRPDRHEQTELSTSAVANDIRAYALRQPEPFAPFFGQPGNEMARQVSEYFLSFLLETVQTYQA